MAMRKSDHTILDLLLDRWSPRAMSGEAILHEELLQIFEAARWAPSSYNNQPWRFVYAHKNSAHWHTLFNLMVPFNQSWAQHAAVLVVIISAHNFSYNNKPSRTHSFDTGAAWQNCALQGFAMGLVVHGMEGFDYERAQQELSIPHDHTIEAMFAIGRPADKRVLPLELQEREVINDRKPIETFIFEGTMKKKEN